MPNELQSGVASEAQDKLLPALLSARKAILPAAKSGKNTFDNYDYATELDWHRAVTPALLDNGLILTFTLRDVIQLGDRTTARGGTEHVVRVLGEAKLWHESGQYITVQGAGDGQDRADKGVYKAITGMKKYLYALLFALPTSDDPEADEGVGQSASPPKDPPKTTQKKAKKPTMAEIHAMIDGASTWKDTVAAEQAIHDATLSPKSTQALISTARAKQYTLTVDVANDLAENGNIDALNQLKGMIQKREWPNAEHKTQMLKYVDDGLKYAKEKA